MWSSESGANTFIAERPSVSQDEINIVYMHHSLVVVFSSPVWPVRLQPRLRNVLSLQYQTPKMSNRCFWTGAEPKPSHMRSICPDSLRACELLPCRALCTHTHSCTPPHHNIPLKPTPCPSYLVGNRRWTSRTSPPAGRTALPSAPWCTASSRTPSSTPS